MMSLMCVCSAMQMSSPWRVSNWKMCSTPATRILKNTAWLLLPNCARMRAHAERSQPRACFGPFKTSSLAPALLGSLGRLCTARCQRARLGRLAGQMPENGMDIFSGTGMDGAAAGKQGPKQAARARLHDVAQLRAVQVLFGHRPEEVHAALRGHKHHQPRFK